MKMNENEDLIGTSNNLEERKFCSKRPRQLSNLYSKSITMLARQIARRRKQRECRKVTSAGSVGGWMISILLVITITTESFSLALQQPISSAHSKPETVAQPTSTSGGSAALAAADQPSINLIPVDQPVVGGGGGGGGFAGGASRSKSFKAASWEQADQQQNAGLKTGQIQEIAYQTVEQLADSYLHNGEPPLEGSLEEETGEQKSQLSDGQKETGYEVSTQQLPLAPEQAGKPNSSQEQRQIPERRFGLFKKGHNFNSGGPMSANYAAGPLLTDCDRCLAGFGQQSADLQQLEPLPAPQPIQPILPSPPASSNQQAFMGHPLKSKFFMKFPFFMKPISFGQPFEFGQHEQVPLWAGQYQTPSFRPQMASAVFIRPAPAYNCIQASPPALVHALPTQTNQLHQHHHHDYVQLNTKTQPAVKQYQQQQQQSTYPSSSY